jgi:hypothetical protein
MLRDATLVAGASLHQLIRPRAARYVRQPTLIGAGLVATAAAVLALVHVTGVDLRSWITPGQVGFVPGLLDSLADPDAQAEAR